MKRMTIALVGLCIIAALSVGVWRIMPGMMFKYGQAQACQSVIDEMRRQLDRPADAIFESCADTLAAPTGNGPLAYALGPWRVFGEYQMRRATSDIIDTYQYYGNAWRSSTGWEATIVNTVAVPD